MSLTLSNGLAGALLNRTAPSVSTENIEGKTFLVTGAGGTIGSQLVQLIANAGAAKIILVDHSEYALYMAYTDEQLMVPRLTSYGSGDVLDILRSYKVDVLVHAGAYKHVPLVELNPIAGVENNVFEFAKLVHFAESVGVPELMVISTDKAVRPSNIMGCTKALVESIAINCKIPKVSVVRFGNVLGSSGSVLPLFERQFKAGQPLTVTHEKVTRYFMSVLEACSLVLRSRELGSGIKVLDMGEPVKILDLAKRYLELQERPDHAIKIVGLRPGEKLHEELYTGSELTPTADKRVLADLEPVKAVSLKRLEGFCRENDLLGLRQELQIQIPSYAPVCAIVDPVFMHKNALLATTAFEDCYRVPSPEKL